jgi:hypothetical protein
MAAVAEARRPWYARAWRTWPVGWQIASFVACLVLVAGTSLLWPVLQQWGGTELAPVLNTVSGPLDGAAVRYAALQRAAEVVWRVAIAPVATFALVPLAIMCAASLAFGAALGRLAFGEASQS